MFYGTNPNEISIFFLIKAEENYKNIARQLYQAAKRQLKEGACLTCVVSHTVTSLNEVGRIEWETENTLYYGQIFSLSSFICCEEEKKKPFELPEEKFKRLKRSAREAESKDVSDIISEILDYCEENTYTQLMVRKTICRIFQCFADIQEAKADEIADTVIYSSGNYTDLKKKILERFHKGNYVENGNPDTSNADFGNEGMGESVSEDIIKKIDDYIVSHYRDTIRVQDLALKFGFNYSYLCTVFRKYKGISPNEYIIEKRVQEAEFLLKNYPEMAVKEIAEKVGYKDSLYFSRIFKKVTGYSPADYRHFAGKEGSL